MVTSTQDQQDQPPAVDPMKTIQDLQLSVKEVTASRDNLLSSLGALRTTMANLQAKVSDLEDENKELTTFKLTTESKLKEAEKYEDIIATLRRSVEESRKGVMRLQTEKEVRRTSGVSAAAAPTGLGFEMPLTLTSPPPPSVVPLTSKRDKRASLNIGHGHGHAPIWHNSSGGGGHRRVSSFSDSGASAVFSEPPASFSAVPPTATRSGGLRELRLPQLSPTLPVAKGGGFFSGWGSSASSAANGVPSVVDLSADDADDQSMLARQHALAKLEGGSPQLPSTTHPSPVPASQAVFDSAELDLLRSEIAVLKNSLLEAHSAREASEAACRALRTFVASGGGGTTTTTTTTGSSLSTSTSVQSEDGENGPMTLSLPPLPSDLIDEDPQPSLKRPSAPTTTSSSSSTSRSWLSFRKPSPQPDSNGVAPTEPVQPQLEQTLSPPLSETVSKPRFSFFGSKAPSSSGKENVLPPLPGGKDDKEQGLSGHKASLSEVQEAEEFAQETATRP